MLAYAMALVLPRQRYIKMLFGDAVLALGPYTAYSSTASKVGILILAHIPRLCLFVTSI